MSPASDLCKRDSSQSTATFASLRSSWRSSNRQPTSEAAAPQGQMAAAAEAVRTRRQARRQNSNTSINSVRTSSTTDSFEAAREHARTFRWLSGSPQPRHSFNNASERPKEFSKSSRVDSSSSKRSSMKAPVRRCETAMQSGRHSNEWVFGGWSLRATVKGLLK